MTGKVLLIALLAAPLIAGCASWQKTPSARPAPDPPIVHVESAATTAANAPQQPAGSTQRPFRSSFSSAVTKSPPQDTPAKIEPRIITKAGAAQAQPVPLFRQAIVLANVRAAVAGLPTQPKAEFQRGLLTLTFPNGTEEEVTAAVNRALAVPEVSRIQVVPTP